MLLPLAAAPLWLQVALGSNTLFVGAPPREGLMPAGGLIGRIGTWHAETAAFGGYVRASAGGVLPLAIEGSAPAEADGPLALVTGGGFFRVSPWGGSVVELAAFTGGAGWSRWHHATGGQLTLGWSWWTGARRWGVEGWVEAAGGATGSAWFGSGLALTIGGARPGDR